VTAARADGDRGEGPGARTLSSAQVVQRLGVTRQTIHRWEAAGVLQRLDRTGPPRYDADEVDRIARRRAAERTPEQLRQALLEQAAALVGEGGAAACTIDAVAERAGVSRGAVVHHFPHKEDLLRGLLQSFIDRFEAAWASQLGDAGVEQGRLAEAYVRATAGPDDVLTAALVVCVAEAPELLAPLREAMRAWYLRVEADARGAGQDVDQVLLRCLAADALWLYRLFGVAPLDPATAARVLAAGTG
jgi:AcrR family transcriptional regulator